MAPNVKQGRRVTAWLGVACLGLLPVSSLPAQEPKLRATLHGHTGAVVAWYRWEQQLIGLPYGWLALAFGALAARWYLRRTP